MNKPILLTVDDDAAVSHAIRRTLRRQYAHRFAGDARRSSMKRVASAVGEGAMAVHLVHRYLDTM